MKLIALSLILALVGQSTLAQKKVSVYDQDTIPIRKLVPIDPHLVYPILKYPLQLCDTMQSVFSKFIRSHRALAIKRGLIDGRHNPYISISFDIDRSGKAFNLYPRKYYSGIDSFCNKIFASLLRSTQWIPFYRRDGKSIRYLDTKAILNFGINNGKIIALQITELRTGNAFFACEK